MEKGEVKLYPFKDELLRKIGKLLLQGITVPTHCRCDFIPDYRIPECPIQRAIQQNEKMSLYNKHKFPEKRVFNDKCWTHTVEAFLSTLEMKKVMGEK